MIGAFSNFVLGSSKRPDSEQIQSSLQLASASLSHTRKQQQDLLHSLAGPVQRAIVQGNAQQLVPAIDNYITASRKLDLISAVLTALQEIGTNATAIATSSTPPPSIETHITTILIVGAELRYSFLNDFKQKILLQLYDPERIALLSSKSYLDGRINQLLFQKQISPDDRDEAIRAVAIARGIAPGTVAKMLNKSPAGVAVSLAADPEGLVELGELAEIPRENWREVMEAVTMAIGPNLKE
jgi:hypothetical protein